MRWSLLLLAAGLAGAQSTADLRRGFEHPPDDARIMMRWWWFGPAVTKPELEREMRLMKEGGIGGFEVQPVYPLELEGNFPYLSNEFLDALRFTAAKARELGLRMDLTLASGWPYRRAARPDHAGGGEAAGRSMARRRMLGPGEKLIGQAEVGGVTYYFISSRTRQMVKRAAVGAEGFVLDHYDRAAIRNASQSGRRNSCWPRPDRTRRTRFSATAWKCTGRTGLPNFLERIPEAARLRPDAVPARAGRRYRTEDAGHPPRLGQDADRTGRRELSDADPRMGASGTARASARRPTALRR